MALLILVATGLASGTDAVGGGARIPEKEVPTVIVVIGNVQISIQKVEQDSPKAEQWLRREQLKKEIQREREEILRKVPEIRVFGRF